jgi:hypothetical protein
VLNDKEASAAAKQQAYMVLSLPQKESTNIVHSSENRMTQSDTGNKDGQVWHDEKCWEYLLSMYA